MVDEEYTKNRLLPLIKGNTNAATLSLNSDEDRSSSLPAPTRRRTIALALSLFDSTLVAILSYEAAHIFLLPRKCYEISIKYYKFP